MCQGNADLGSAAMAQGIAEALLGTAQERLGLMHVRHAQLGVQVEGHAWPGQVRIESAQRLMQIHAIVLAQRRHDRADVRKQLVGQAEALVEPRVLATAAAARE